MCSHLSYINGPWWYISICDGVVCFVNNLFKIYKYSSFFYNEIYGFAAGKDDQIVQTAFLAQILKITQHNPNMDQIVKEIRTDISPEALPGPRVKMMMMI